MLPLGSGACSGTSLPIDRALVARLLGFPRVTANALDTVGDRDFALDWVWAGARASLALARIAADVIDFSTSEFGFVTLDGEHRRRLVDDAAEEEPRRLRAPARQRGARDRRRRRRCSRS